MWPYIARRLRQAILILFIITMLCFILTRLSSDPMAQYATRQGMTDADRAQLRHSLGLDQPLPIQYLRVARSSQCRATSAPRSSPNSRS